MHDDDVMSHVAQNTYRAAITIVGEFAPQNCTDGVLEPAKSHMLTLRRTLPHKLLYVNVHATCEPNVPSADVIACEVGLAMYIFSILQYIFVGNCLQVSPVDRNADALRFAFAYAAQT